jgi:putative transposase
MERGWRRTRLRLYPAKPKVGLRASRPDVYWHVDASILRLVDGTRVYLHAAIDNYSRRILAWRVEESLNPLATFHVLQEAAEGLGHPARATEVVMDSGVENVNSVVAPLFATDTLHRVLAQVDVNFSNSMIESWWRCLKHQWLYLHQLDSIATVRKLVEFYVSQHNTVMPHAAFAGLTPDEVYFGRTEGIVEELAEKRAAARVERVRRNREVTCPGCRPPTSMLKREAA